MVSTCDGHYMLDHVELHAVLVSSRLQTLPAIPIPGTDELCCRQAYSTPLSIAYMALRSLPGLQEALRPGFVQDDDEARMSETANYRQSYLNPLRFSTCNSS